MKRNLLRNIIFKKTNIGSMIGGHYFQSSCINVLKGGITKYNPRNDFLFLRNGKTVNFFSSEKNPLHNYTKEQIEEKVLNVLKKYLPNNAEIKYNEELEKNKTKDNRNWDFLDTVEFLIDVESEFNITIPDETADNIKSVQDLIDYLAKLKNTAA